MKYIKLFENFNTFSEEQLSNAQNLFKEVFDKYLKKVSPNTYPMIYHCTSINNLESIEKNGLTSKLNYFLEYDNDMNNYGFSENGEEEPGIACGVNYKDVIDRLYPDPEWNINILKKTGNPSKFDVKGIDDRILLCYWVIDTLGLDLDEKLTLEDISEEKMNYMIEENLFCWLYVKGQIQPNLLKIEIHPDLK